MENRAMQQTNKSLWRIFTFKQCIQIQVKIKIPT